MPRPACMAAPRASLSGVLKGRPGAVIAERGDADESLIDPIHGHGSQSLINLLLTGSATQVKVEEKT